MRQYWYPIQYNIAQRSLIKTIFQQNIPFFSIFFWFYISEFYLKKPRGLKSHPQSWTLQCGTLEEGRKAFVLLGTDDRADIPSMLMPNAVSKDFLYSGAAVLFSFSYSWLPSTAPPSWLQSTAPLPPTQRLRKPKIPPSTTTPFVQQVRKRQCHIRLKLFQSGPSLIWSLTKWGRRQPIIIIRRRIGRF